jgi:16S rRNA G966 N2-methylase RsmD
MSAQASMSATKAGKFERAAQHKLKIMRHRACLAAAPACLGGMDWQVLHGDMEELAGKMGKVHSIITDPPYTKDTYQSAADKLGKVARKSLIPGGNLLVWTGQLYMPQIVDILIQHGMTWRWVIAYLTPGPVSRVWPPRVTSNWIPVVWLTNGASSLEKSKIPHDKPSFTSDLAFSPAFEHLDVAISGGRCKRFHRWGKSSDGADQLVRDYSFEGETIFDPFCGGGAIGEAAISMGRKFIGIDKDVEAVQTTASRLANMAKEKTT